MTTIEEAKHEIESHQIPNSEVFRDLATHLQNWASQHQEFLQQLDTGHGALKESWEGDGSDAYTQLHIRSQDLGKRHLEHFQQATDALKQTANLVDDAHEKKSSAWKWVLGLGILAVLTLGIALAGLPAVIAGIVAAIGAAVAFFTTTFGALVGLAAIIGLIAIGLASGGGGGGSPLDRLVNDLKTKPFFEVVTFYADLIGRNFSQEEFLVVMRNRPLDLYGVMAVYAKVFMYVEHMTNPEEQNAVRHVLWQCLLKKQFGEDFARKIGDAHEHARPGSDADNKADEINNEIGLQLADQVQSADMCFQRAQEMWEAGQLQTRTDLENDPT